MGGPKGKSVALGEERSAGASRSHSGGGGKASFLDADASGESKNESTFRDLFRASFFSKIRPAPHSSKTGMRFNLVTMAKIQPTNGQHSANIQSTFSQHSVNIQPTFSQHLPISKSKHEVKHCRASTVSSVARTPSAGEPLEGEGRGAGEDRKRIETNVGGV